MNTPISFEIAKLLKEKGFDNQTRDAFNMNGLKVYCDPTFMSGLGDSQGFKRWNKEWNYYARPTIGEVVMWLYKNHRIWIEPFWDVVNLKEENELNWFFDISYVGNIEFSNILSRDLGLEFKTPTEAYEAAIKHTLENIIK